VEPLRKGSGVGYSFRTQIFRRFLRHRLALVGAVFLLLLALAAVLSPWITPYSASKQNRRHAFTAPSLTVVEGINAPCERAAVLFWRCGAHPFGTDDLGRDILTRVLAGGRVSLLVGFIAGGMATALGTLIGATAGYAGGVLDALVCWIMDFILSIPQLPLVLILIGLLAAQQSTLAGLLTRLFGNYQSAGLVVFVVVLLTWPVSARLVRSQILSLREEAFVEAARGIGASSRRILFRHILPNVTAIVIVQGTLAMGYAILTESALSFLGLGVQPPAVSWGNMLSQAQAFLYYPNGIYMAVFPGAAILLTVLSVNFLGDGLREALDPRQYGKGGAE